MDNLFKDREDAGEKLAKALEKYKKQRGVIIALPRGGVVVANIVARTLNLPLHVICPKKIGAPFNEELAVGAVLGDMVFLNDFAESIDEKTLKETIETKKMESKAKEKLYKKKELPPLDDMIAIVIDDGIATGATLEVSIAFLKKRRPKKIIIAVPVAPKDILEELKKKTDEVICLHSPYSFMAIGQFYQSFEEIKDNTVIDILKGY